MAVDEKTVGGRLVRRVGMQARLFAAFGALILLMGAMAWIAAWRLADLETKITAMAAVNVRVERLVGDWLTQTKANGVRSMVLTQSDDPALGRLLGPDFEATTRTVNQLQEQIERLVTTSGGNELLKKIAQTRKAYLDARKSVLEKKKAGDADGATALLASAMVPALNTYVDAIGSLGEFYSREVARDTEAAVQSAAAGRRLLVGLCGIGLLLAILGSWLITRSVTQPVREAVLAARRVADGDLNVRIATGGRDELGQLLEALADMAARLRALVADVANGARSVAQTSAQIAQGNVDLSQRTEEQASTLEETASSMEELTTTVAQNADHARLATDMAVGASQVAREGGEVMGAVVRTMNGISESSRKISDIIGVIDGIAFQTNILALNAAVEAARAGEQGRGFAVVATEVRNLAQRSAAAAKEIKGLISASVEQVDSGSRLVDAAGAKMKDIVQQVTKVSGLIAEIAQASQEQSSGIEQVNVAMTQMDQGVQQNASLVEEAAAATESMKAQAGTLLQLVARFRLEDGAAAAASAHAPAAEPLRVRTRAAVRAAPEQAWAALPDVEPPLAVASGQWREF